MKFAFGVVVGYLLFHPLKDDSKFDQATLKTVRSAGDKLTDFITKKLEKVTGA